MDAGKADSSILMVNPPLTYQAVLLLPDEMIRYELESQGRKSASSIRENRSILYKLISEGNYKPNKQIVALGYRDNYELCNEYYERWNKEIIRSRGDSKCATQYLIKLEFLSNRLQGFDAPSEDVKVKFNLDKLRQHVSALMSHLKSLQVIDEHLISPKNSPEKSAGQKFVEDWPVDPVRYSLPGASDRTSKFKNDRHSTRMPQSRMDNESAFYSDEDDPRVHENVHFIENRIPADSRSISRQNCVSCCQNSTCGSRPKVEVWKWGIKFSGSPYSMNVLDFLRKVRELMKSRKATEDDVFASASDLFIESALNWYRAGNFSSWVEIEKGLKKDFLGYDYEEDLYEYVKTRLQKDDESIVVYFANMEELFRKLGDSVDERHRVKIIKRNLRSEFIASLSLLHIRSVAELKEHCKNVEADMIHLRNRSRYNSIRNFESSHRHVRLSDENRSRDNFNHNSFESNSFRGNNPYSRRNFESNNPSFPPGSFSRNRSSSPYRPRYEESFDEQMRELSIREDPHRPVLSVPSPSIVHSQVSFPYPPPQVNSNGHTNSSSRTYSAPQRNYSQVPSYNNQNNSQLSGNGSWRQPPRTPASPILIRRPM